MAWLHNNIFLYNLHKKTTKIQIFISYQRIMHYLYIIHS